MKIGIFLGYGPQTRLEKEGLGRYIGGLVKGFLENGDEITIACPHWLDDSLKELMKSFSIGKKKLSWISPAADPPIWRIYSRMVKPREEKEETITVRELVRSGLKALAVRLAESVSIPEFLLVAVAGGLACVVICPFLLIYLLLRYIVKGIRFLASVIGKKLNAVKNNIITDKASFGAASAADSAQLFQKLQIALFEKMGKSVNRWLVDRINGNKTCEVWFVPALFWPEVNAIEKTVVINAPDMVPSEFPYGFADALNTGKAIQECRKTLEKGKFFITYNDFIKRTLFKEQYVVDSDHVIPIRHMNNSMKEYITIDEELTKRIQAKKDLSEAFAKNLLHSLNPVNCSPGYALQANWENNRYIFYPSQVRPNKNILTLVKAYEHLLRKKSLPYKLVLTCNPKNSYQVSHYVLEKELYNDVLFFFDVPAQKLAALYARAELVVNPTLFEGGFPFTFGEGMSVGTPSIMSRIPQVEDVIVPAGLEEIMFDPYDWKDVAETIDYWLPRTEELYQKELPLYKELEKRTPDVVAAEYVEAFKKFILLDRIETRKEKEKKREEEMKKKGRQIGI